MKMRTLSAAVLLQFMMTSTVFLAPAWAADNAPLSDAEAASFIIPAQPGWPLAHPVSTKEVAPPPLSLVKDQPVNPAYVPGLPGFKERVAAKDDNGRTNMNSDSILIRQSKVENGQVVIPPGGLVYLQDPTGGQVALQGEPIHYLGKQPTYIDYNMVIDVKKNVTIPAGGSVVIGGQVYYYGATVSHETLNNHTMDVKTIAGTDWDWAFGEPVFSDTETNWWPEKRFNMLYNQGVLREQTNQNLVFDWISGVRMDSLLMANTKVFNDYAKTGQEWKVGIRVVRLSSVDEQAGTANVQILEGGKEVFSKTLGPVQKKLLNEDTNARKDLLFQYEDVAGFLVPNNSFRNGEAQLKIYGDAFTFTYGQDYAQDARFSVWPVGCPTGHNFGIMWTNKEAMTIPAGGSVTGPEGYFKIAVDKIQNGQVLAWHVEDNQGNRSVNLGGPDVENVDLVLGQGRVTGSDLLKNVGRQALVRTYNALAQNQSALSGPVTAQSFPYSPVFITAIITLGLVGIITEIRRRQKARQINCG
ncbi:hypothetical protein [Paenibacillus thalictri]|uniref:hypothetical protein n=1 Tax=Paenibacillus thalictri TaxID=2527873 RepID=UPI001981C780|nr:hypothetical protein [Paenibacillus thalictri]